MLTTPPIEALRRSLGTGKVITMPEALDGYRHDYWMVSHARDLAGRAAPRPACVVKPAGVDDVRETLRLAAEHRTPVIPFGLGSGVVGGVIASPEAIVLDMGAMATVRFIDEINLLAGFDAGKNGLEAEQAVAAQNLTIGHWPQSIAVSSVGGWVATRSSGQFSTGNGNVEDIIHTIEAVLPGGDLVILGRGPRASAGPDLRHLMLGSEGTLGVITGVTFSLRRAPQARLSTAFRIAEMTQGFALQREIVQSGWRPPVMRQYDQHESRRLEPESAGCLLLMIHEGPSAMVRAEVEAVTALADAAGAQRGPEEIVDRWFAHRNQVTPWERILSRNIVADTVEVSSDWSSIGAIYHDAIASLREVEGCLAASAHSSHAYRSGLNLYFTFAVQVADLAGMEAAYFDCWRRIINVTCAQGGSLSHHHGIGRVRRDYLHRELGKEGVALLQRLKAAIDPAGIMNPGVLIPDA